MFGLHSNCAIKAQYRISKSQNGTASNQNAGRISHKTTKEKSGLQFLLRNLLGGSVVQTKVNPTEEAVQAGSDRLPNANVVTLGIVVAKTSNDKMASGEAIVVDHVFNKTSPQDDPFSQIEHARSAPTPIVAFTPEINRDDTQGNSGSGTLAHRQDDPARTREPKTRNVSSGSSAASRYVGAKRRLIELWHQSLAKSEKSRNWTAFSNLNRGTGKKAAYTAETNH